VFDISRPYGTLMIQGLLLIYQYLAPIGACPYRDKILVVSMMRYIIKSRRDVIDFYRTVVKKNIKDALFNYIMSYVCDIKHNDAKEKKIHT